MHLHWALVHLRFGDQFKAAIKFRKSFLLLKENQELFPDFPENQVLLGLENAIAGTIPDSYKWLAAVMGIKGNVHNGVAQLSGYLNAYPQGNGKMQEEAMIYYTYLKFYLQNNQEAAWQYINGAHFDEDNNLMRSFIKANLALNYRKAEQALAILTKASTIVQYQQYPILQYELAEAMLAKQNEQCIAQYQQFIIHYKGQHFVKDAWLKMAWIAHLQGNTTTANHYLVQLIGSGKAATDADKQAQRFAEKPNWPLKKLLAVRILIDAGYYSKALAIIQNIDKESMQSKANILEYNFRYGRIFEELGYSDKALQFYTATVNVGRNEKWYFAARAALHKGFIYERKERIADAIAAYRECLSMRNHDAQASIDQLAKAAINRLSK
ncbi:MAG: hypothetical protein IT256_07620 [Chitinophagaceae bacterium]|nr:hypothetical protein [Chitinophagaceae bacterium]